MFRTMIRHSTRYVFAALTTLFWISPSSAQQGRIGRPPQRVEVRERERVREIRSEPTEWFRVERELNRSDMEALWRRLDIPTRTRVSEALGERIMEKEITRFGFVRVCSSRAASERPQGFDAVVRKDGLVIVAEAKATSQRRSLESLLKEGYGYRQGSLEWARASANAILRSERANWREKQAAGEVLEAYKRGRLSVLVFVTQHTHGRVVDHYVCQTAGPPVR